MSEDANRAWKDQYMLRFPDGMRERLKRAASDNNRSMNAEIIARLEASFMHPLGQDPASFPDAGAIADEVVRRLVDRDKERIAAHNADE